MPRMRGYVATSATTEAAVNGTAYTEQTSGAQRSMKSSSAADAAAGTGARTVRITYFTLVAGVTAGPFTEDVTLNGVTAVATVATDIALIEKLECLTAGSGGKNAGTVTLYNDNAGVGSAVCSIAIGDKVTYLGLAYVASGQRLSITDVVALSGEDQSVLTNFAIRSLDYSVSHAVEKPQGKALRVQGSNPYGIAAPNPLISSGQLPIVAGPARVQWYVTPGAATATVQQVDVGFTRGG